VEMLSEHVDVISPMLYPSHFPNNFLNFPPYEERPYRIYYYGTLRSLIMAEHKVEIRSWIQAFLLNSQPYDREYYNVDYVANSIIGCIDADRNAGFTLWHAGTQYPVLIPAFERTKNLVSGIRHALNER